ncbi:MAG: phage tail protein [Gallionellales bacterium RBG_16_57_15]|nr:MAG: phage tail protein [Gallionellales bacterium RBG_16_57_15]
MADPKAIVRRLSSLRSLRQPHEQAWQECFDYSFPERGTGLMSSELTPQSAQTKKNRILDDTAADSARILSAGLVSGTTPANSIWFGLDSGNEQDDKNSEQDDEDRWLDDASRTIFANIHSANFDAAAYECCIDIVPAGWFVLYVDENPEGGYQFEQWPIAQCFISASKRGGLVDTIFREDEPTVEQLVTEYGIDNVSDDVRNKFKNEKFDEKVKICHAIYPRKIYAVGGRMAKNLPFESCHVEINNNHLLRESGYHEFPCVVPRWMLTPGTSYATGPMSSALGSIRTINDIKAMELLALDIAAAGMYKAVDDGVLNPTSIKLGPRKIIVMNSIDSMQELKSGADFNVTFSAEDRLQSAIRKILLADQLQPQGGPAMTATEIHVRVALIRQLLGPIYGRLQAEYLQPLITRCFGLAYRAGVLGEAPPSLQGRVFTVKYISPLARAQRLEDVTAMDRLETTLLAEAQADPGVLDVYDFEAAARERSDFLGVPKSVIRTQKQVDSLRDTRKKVQQEQQQKAQAAGMQQVAGEAMINKMAA